MALKDKLHQPYRAKLAPGLDKLSQALKHEDSVLGVVLCGAGPSVLVISEKTDLEKIKTIIKESWNDLNINVQLYTLPVETNGATVIAD